MAAQTVIYGQDPPLDLDFVIYKGVFWKGDLAWQNEDGNPVPAADKVIQLRWDRSDLVDPTIYPPDLDSTLDAVPALNTVNYLHLADGQIEIGLTSEATALLGFASTGFHMYLLTDGVPELWAKGRARLVI